MPTRPRDARRTAGLGIAVGLAALAAGAPTARASPLELFGLGGRSPALAGLGAADVASYEAAYLNPAGLAELGERHVAVGYQFGDVDLDLDGREVATDRPVARVIGAALPLPLGGRWAGRVGLGLGFVAPSNAVAKVEAPLPGQPFFPVLATRAHVLGVQVGAGVALSPRWKLGVGVLALAGLRGTIFIDAEGGGHISTRSEERLTADYAPIVGVRYRPSSRLALGAALRGEAEVSYDLEIGNDLATELPLSLPVIHIAGVAQYDPMTLALEAAYQAGDHVRVLGGLAYQRWSAFPLPTEDPLAQSDPQPPPDFHDVVIPRIGGEGSWALGGARVLARAGYGYLRSPAPEASGRQSLLDNHRHLLAGGVGLGWPGTRWPFHLDLWFQLHALVPRVHTKDLARFGPGDPPPFERTRATGHIAMAGALVGVDL